MYQAYFSPSFQKKKTRLIAGYRSTENSICCPIYNYKFAVTDLSVISIPVSLLTGRRLRLGYSSPKWRRYGKETICLSPIYRRAAAMMVCFELQQSHEMDYENGAHFAVKFIQDIWQIRTLHRNGMTWDVYIK